MKVSVHILIIFVLCFGLLPVTAGDSTQTQNSRFIILPVLAYAPETKLEFGGRLGYVFHTSGLDTTAKPSNTGLVLSYTQKQQFIGQWYGDLYFKNEKYLISGELNYSKYPDLFYGIGNDIDTDDEEKFTPLNTELILSFKNRMWRSLYLGLQLEIFNGRILETEEQGLLAGNTILGSDGGLSSGVGPIFQWDTRDNIFAPLRGSFHQISLLHFDQWLGSEYSYNRLQLDLRKYFPFFSDHTLAVQGFINSIAGDPPFDRLALLGSEIILRGYHKSLYRDKNMWAVQGEYRLPLFWKLGLTGFAGLGNVHESISDYSFNNSKYSLGLGLRYFLVPSEKINVRLDVAFGEDSSGIYIYFLEAF